MFFFKKRKKKKKESNKFEEFLNTVDKEYMLAYATKSPQRLLQHYMSRKCIIKISQSIFSVGSRYFGAEKFRNTKWIQEEVIGNSIKVRKEVSFDKIKVAGSLRIEVADDYREEWMVLLDGDKYIVTDIKKIM